MIRPAILVRLAAAAILAAATFTVMPAAAGMKQNSLKANGIALKGLFLPGKAPQAAHSLGLVGVELAD